MLPWAVLVLWNVAFYGPPMARMTEAVGGMVGGLPGFAVPLPSLAMALVLGTLGGAAGAPLRKQLVPQKAPAGVQAT